MGGLRPLPLRRGLSRQQRGLRGGSPFQVPMSDRSFVLHDKVTINMVNATALEVFSAVGKIDAAREQGVRLSQMKMAVVVSNKTDTEYPILYGLAVGGMSAAEI